MGPALPRWEYRLPIWGWCRGSTRPAGLPHPVHLPERKLSPLSPDTRAAGNWAGGVPNVSRSIRPRGPIYLRRLQKRKARRKPDDTQPTSAPISFPPISLTARVQPLFTLQLGHHPPPGWYAMLLALAPLWVGDMKNTVVYGSKSQRYSERLHLQGGIGRSRAGLGRDRNLPLIEQLWAGSWVRGFCRPWVS